ncbi:MAG TPA: DNA/RNA helicase domain-containing protein [Microbacteriaceae bacterium]|nr:DNA/RNA helicase domain-containing protein [Microbacteriaceae bacterium]
MTRYQIERFSFDQAAVSMWSASEAKASNWPVVYTLDDNKEVYVGESLNGVSRMRQHLQTTQKQHLQQVQVVIDETFNKSVCLDLESFLIRMFAGDGKFAVLNKNIGITDAQYFNRDDYQTTFEGLFEELRRNGYFTRSLPEILNSDLFKLSPFKALTTDQAIAVEDILEGLFDDLESNKKSTIVVQGDPGTGKTILAIYLIKLLSDIQNSAPFDDYEPDSIYSDFFADGFRELLTDFRIGFVIPQQSLRSSVSAVFAKTPGLDPEWILTPFEVGEAKQDFDLLIVDEAHRLNQLSAQSMGTLTKKFREINERLFGEAGRTSNQLDWIRAKSRHQIFLFDVAQTVRPSDLPRQTLETLQTKTKAESRFYPLTTQMRVKAGSDYVGFVKQLLTGDVLESKDFGEYDFRFFDDFDEMYAAVQNREQEVGLSRLLAGYAWKWQSRKDRSKFDIELGQHKLRWNISTTDWINSSNPTEEVGSIHTIQGYDLNYAGVIIGGDLRLDTLTGKTVFDRSSYFDARGKSNNNILEIKYDDSDLLEYVRNIYSVLLTRGILGTYVYVVDEALRSKFQDLFN